MTFRESAIPFGNNAAVAAIGISPQLVVEQCFGASDATSIERCFYGLLITEGTRKARSVRQINLYLSPVSTIFVYTERLNHLA